MGARGVRGQASSCINCNATPGGREEGSGGSAAPRRQEIGRRAGEAQNAEKEEMDAIAKLQNSQRIFQSARSEFEELTQLQAPALPVAVTAQIDTGLRSRPPLPRPTRLTPRGDSTREEDERKP